MMESELLTRVATDGGVDLLALVIGYLWLKGQFQEIREFKKDHETRILNLEEANEDG